jgi:hypothetical protein
MANSVWHVELEIKLDLERADLDHPDRPGLWDLLYAQDRQYAADRVPVEQRGLQCAGVCRDAGVVAWMHLRRGPNGQRVAVHQRREDEARHRKESPEHRAYKERIVRVAIEAGHAADTEVSAPGMVTDALVEGPGGLQVGWEVQLSTAGYGGPRSVRARARRAVRHGITPAWHTDRREYANRHDTQWTRSDRLPAQVIAKNGDLRIVSGYRVLDFFRCDSTADVACPDTIGYRRCGKVHAEPKPRDIMFDDVVRGTAAGVVVPLEYRLRSRTHRFWVPAPDRERYWDILEDKPVTDDDPASPSSASRNPPTCRPQQDQAQSRPETLPRQVRVVDWNHPRHWSPTPAPCRYCAKPANMRDDQGRSTHKVCYEQAMT